MKKIYFLVDFFWNFVNANVVILIIKENQMSKNPKSIE